MSAVALPFWRGPPEPTVSSPFSALGLMMDSVGLVVSIDEDVKLSMVDHPGCDGEWKLEGQG